jgi:regulator of Ty1 transposition protein 109
MGDVAASKSLLLLLAQQLPEYVPFTFYHYSTPPVKSPALYNAPPHRKPERTYCESHFLAASLPRGAGIPNELLVLAIEVLIYTTKQLTTIFVSKADSTGWLSAPIARSHAGSPLKAICGTFVSWLAQERQREGKRLVVSLFARAQDQYLFPASIDNPNKHVLDDRGLVKWWCRVLDPILRAYAPEPEKKSLANLLAESKDTGKEEPSTSETDKTAKGYLFIPGYDPYDILRYTPAPQPSSPRRWAASHPLREIAPYPAAPPRCLVPNFPDDPKARFLSELDEELPDSRGDEMSQAGGTPSRSNGHWKSVKTLEQFWEMMAFRQECSSGRIVGFIWVVITPPNPSIPEEDEDEPSQSQVQNDSQHSVSVPSMSPRRKARRRKVNTESGPIPIILPRIKSSNSNLSTTSVGSSSGSAKLPPETSPYYIWPRTSRGTVLLSTTAYNRALEVLLQQNFATQSAAARSTKRWIDEVAVLAGEDYWGLTTLGEKPVTAAAAPVSNGTAPVTIMGVRKKRKPDAAVEEKKDIISNGIEILGEGMVRKKPKVEASPRTDSGAANGVNTLGSGLVRKKPKS